MSIFVAIACPPRQIFSNKETQSRPLALVNAYCKCVTTMSRVTVYRTGKESQLSTAVPHSSTTVLILVLLSSSEDKYGGVTWKTIYYDKLRQVTNLPMII